ncbi:GntR family transcriptional regulator [Phytoactinopolyspora alkaliphila]|uniref:GntR family transcriptional regulator n=1 Tax=Phytoactinopolyspora alkaliphila TaxID=1783498 RepID=A0A6N9YNH6_9ACTN|nr:GntR family transcriptional regulator [Phytoactinopolyspora alkaliphila]NED96495.1 GntR family transcriptional regulator [Phytoactinopolyspora alkaliphila]
MGHLTSELVHLLSGLNIVRKAGAPIHEQLRHHLQYLITTAALGPGAPLPSVRQLAEELHVARATVQRAYTELQTLGLIEARHGAGTFVVDFRRAVGSIEGSKELSAIVETAISDARRLGLDLRDLERLLHVQVRAELRSEGEFLICYVDEFDFSVGHTAVLIESLTDLPVRIVRVDWRRCRNGDREPLAALEAADLIVCAPYVFGPVNRMLELHSADVEGITFVLHDEVAAALSQLDPASRVGIVATRPEYMSWTSAVVTSRVVTAEEIRQAALTDVAGTEAMLREVDVVVYGSGSRPEIEKLLPAGVRSVELRHVPDPNSLIRLRDLVTRRIDGQALSHGGAVR